MRATQKQVKSAQKELLVYSKVFLVESLVERQTPSLDMLLYSSLHANRTSSSLPISRMVRPMVSRSNGYEPSYSLSLALPVGPSSSSSLTTMSSPAATANSALCKIDLSSVFRGSTSSIGFNFALFRNLRS